MLDVKRIIDAAMLLSRCKILKGIIKMKMIKAFLLAAVSIVALCADAHRDDRDDLSGSWTDPETGIIWDYDSIDYDGPQAGINIAGIGGATTSGAIVIPSTLGGYPVMGIAGFAFANCSSLTSVTIPDSVTFIGGFPFENCSSLRNVEFKGVPPTGWWVGDFPYWGHTIFLPRKYGSEWLKALSTQHFGSFIQSNRPVVEYVSVKVREKDPTILDCVFRVTSGKPTVKVRALAFKDGVRSFANVVRPETFVEGTAVNVGDAVAANVEHKLSWKVSADWGIDLAKVMFEVLATEDDLLPLELRTIPANGSNKAMEFSWNAIASDQVFSALLWLYVDKDAGLTLSSGTLMNGSSVLVNGAALSNPSAISYVFLKMGFSTLSDDTLTYVNAMTRLGLLPDDVRQYAYRWIEK